MTDYRVAIIGLGRIASTIDDELRDVPGVMLPYSHMACLQETSGVQVVAAADPYPEQREAFRQRWGVDLLFADYRDLLTQVCPDLVTVATSTRSRAAIIQDCARAGVRGIYAEKPLCSSLAEADAAIGVCRQYGVTLAVGCTRRSDAQWNTARSLIDAGQIGPILQVTAYGQAHLSHNGSHLLDLVRYLAAGDVNWVFGEMERDDRAAGDADLQGNGYLAFDNGVRAFVRTWPCGGANWEFEVIGETGRLRSVANGQDYEFWQTSSSSSGPIRRIFPRPPRLQSPGVRAFHDFITAVSDGRKPNCSGDDARAALEIAIALRESHRQGGRRVDLPLANRELRIDSSETQGGDVPVALRRSARTSG